LFRRAHYFFQIFFPEPYLSPQLKMLWIADSVPGGFKTI